MLGHLRVLDKNGAITSGRILLAGRSGDIDIAALPERSPQLLGIRGGRIGLIFLATFLLPLAANVLKS